MKQITGISLLAFFLVCSSLLKGQQILEPEGNEDWGHNAVIRWFPDKKIIIIVCTNSGEVGGDKQVTGNRMISDYIADYLFKKK